MWYLPNHKPRCRKGKPEKKQYILAQLQELTKENMYTLNIHYQSKDISMAWVRCSYVPKRTAEARSNRPNIAPESSSRTFVRIRYTNVSSYRYSSGGGLDAVAYKPIALAGIAFGETESDRRVIRVMASGSITVEFVSPLVDRMSRNCATRCGRGQGV